MDKKCEVEIKVDATGLDPKKFMAFVVSQVEHIEKLKIINGTDTFYRHGEDVIRHRCDGEAKDSVLTVKKRKSADSIVNRYEVDLPIKSGVDPEMVGAFFEMSGWKKEFSIVKEYHFFVVSGKDYKACIAMYDVWKNPKKKYRFLEVEIERESECSAKRAESYLVEWLERIKKDLLPAAKPLNVSLYELFSKE